MRGISSLPLLPGPLAPDVVASDRVIFMVQIELFDNECKQMTYSKLSWLK